MTYCKCVTNHSCQEGRNQDSPYLVSRNSAPFHTICPCVCACGVYQGAGPRSWNDVFPCGTAVRVVYITLKFSTLLTGEFICNCFYLNWLGNKSLAKRSFRKVVLADLCRGFNLAIPSSSVYYHECVPNRACQEGRKSGLSLICFRKSLELFHAKLVYV